MPAWKKVLTSGSAAAVSSLTSSGAISCSGVFTTEVIHGDLGEATGLEIAGYFSGSGATATGSFMTSIYSQGTILANTTVTATTDLLVGGNIQHLGNLTNEISFAANTQDYRTNNGSRLDISNSGIRLGGAGARVTSITDDDSLGTSDTLLCTQGNVKAYADTKLSLAGGTMTGQLNFNSQNAINVDLNSGTIDNCVIGASTAVAATFTDLTTTGDTTLGNAITDQNTIQGHITASGAVSASGTVTANNFVGERIFIGGASANCGSTTTNAYFYAGTNGLSSNTWNVQVTDPTSIPPQYVNNLHIIPCGVKDITLRSHSRIAADSKPSIWIYTGSFGNNTNSNITMGFAASQSLHSPTNGISTSGTKRFVINITGSKAFAMTGDNDVIAVMMKNEGTAGAWRFNYRLDGITTE